MFAAVLIALRMHTTTNTRTTLICKRFQNCKQLSVSNTLQLPSWKMKYQYVHFCHHPGQQYQQVKNCAQVGQVRQQPSSSVCKSGVRADTVLSSALLGCCAWSGQRHCPARSVAARRQFWWPSRCTSCWPLVYWSTPVISISESTKDFSDGNFWYVCLL